MKSERFYLSLIDEVEGLAHNDPQETNAVARYYKGLIREPQLRPFYQYNWLRRVTPMVELALSLPPRDKPWQILDAGCGVGTEALLWASLRSDVTVMGVDASSERIAAAKSRLHFYQRIVDHPLSVSFSDLDVHEVIANQSFDLIWAMESLSHIDPAEQFLAGAYDCLAAGGRLVISDSHLWNPVMAWRIFKLRHHGVSPRTQKRLPSGKTISYAQERLFGIGHLTRLLTKIGFEAPDTQLSVFFPPNWSRYSFLFRLGLRIDSIGNVVPGLRNLGGIYTLAASK